MALNETTKRMRELLAQISVDLEKGSAGNKAASQRVRTGTIKLEKIAKVYRKESIAHEKANVGQKRKKQSAQGAKKKAQPPVAKAKAKAQPAKKAVHAAPKKPMAAKKATAKIPVRK